MNTTRPCDDPIRLLGAARLVVGAFVFLFPGAAVRLFTGRAGDGPESRLFARGFGARDAALGVGMLAGPPLPWLAAAAAADGADTLAVLIGWRRLDRRRRLIALVASLVPALVGCCVLGRATRR